MRTKEIISIEDFKQVIQSGVTLIDFNTPWCAPCLAQMPIIDNLAKRYNGRARITAMNVHDHPILAKELGIRSVPTLVFFKNGKEIQRLVGLQSESTLSEALEKMVTG